MSVPAPESYLDFLEQQHFKDSLPEEPPNSTIALSPLDSERWLKAAEAIQPRSRFGFLGGMTQKDLERARSLLEGNPIPSRAALVVKRLMDILFAAFCLIVLAPVFIAIAIIIKTDSPGPVLFRQERVGLHGEAFFLLKFRTMVIDADERLQAELHAIDKSKSIMFRLMNDPRVSRSGRWLRRYSLDELPQFWSVLRGDMSLVGPRPILTRGFQLSHTSDGGRFSVKPGITGLWLLSGATSIQELDWETLVSTESYYAEHWSLALDLKILIRTVGSVFRRPQY